MVFWLKPQQKPDTLIHIFVGREQLTESVCRKATEIWSTAHGRNDSKPSAVERVTPAHQRLSIELLGFGAFLTLAG
jgi:hypothetical protein